MQVYIWRHNKQFHSHSMMNEPCVSNEFYVDALAIVAAESQADAIAQLVALDEGWRSEDLSAMEPKVYDVSTGSIVLYTELR